MKEPQLVLASSSTYRHALLKKLQIDFLTDIPDVDETPLANEMPASLALRLCRLKALKLSDKYLEHLIIGSDQVVCLEATQLCKPGSRENSIAQLNLISGKKVNFFTSVGVVNSKTGEFYSDLDQCAVYFKTLNQRQIESYVEKESVINCAGAFKSEGLGITLIEKIQGEDPNALVGLPLIKLVNLLAKFNYPIL